MPLNHSRRGSILQVSFQPIWHLLETLTRNPLRSQAVLQSLLTPRGGLALSAPIASSPPFLRRARCGVTWFTSTPRHLKGAPPVFNLWIPIRRARAPLVPIAIRCQKTPPRQGKSPLERQLHHEDQQPKRVLFSPLLAASTPFETGKSRQPFRSWHCVRHHPITRQGFCDCPAAQSPAPAAYLIRPHSQSTEFQSPGGPLRHIPHIGGVSLQAPETTPASIDLPRLVLIVMSSFTSLEGVIPRSYCRMSWSPLQA